MKKQAVCLSLISLLAMPLVAADLLVEGHLDVSGTTNAAGAANNTATFGFGTKNGAQANDPAPFGWFYEDTQNGGGTLTSTTSHTNAVWKWTNSANSELMKLGSTGLTVTGNVVVTGSINSNGIQLLSRKDGVGTNLTNGATLAIGNNATASNQNAIAIGSNSSALGNASLALGQGNVANSEGNTAVGINLQTSGWLASAFGTQASALADGATAHQLGYATGQWSYAGMMGYASGPFSMALGGGWQDFAWGAGTGNGNLASGGSSTSLGGLYNLAAGFASYSLGSFSASQSAHQVSLGSMNLLSGGNATQWIDTDVLFALGNGSPENNLNDLGIDIASNGHVDSFYAADRSNAITTLKNGQTTLTNKEWKAADEDEVPFTPSAPNSEGNALVIEGNTVAKGTVTIQSDVNVINNAVIRIPKAGDISMGLFE